MSVRNAGIAIREARKYAGLSQEQLSENICSPIELSRIERGYASASSTTFQSLMSRAGVPCKVFPTFENWKDYEIFSDLIHVRFHLDVWQLDAAFADLEKAENGQWNHNKLHYQTWLMLYGILHFRSGLGNHQYMYDFFLTALHITKPAINFSNIHKDLLSVQEIELLIYIAQELLELNQSDLCGQICNQIFSYLDNRHITYMEKDRLLAECAIVYVKYLISRKEYTKGRELADYHIHQMNQNLCTAPLFELAFLSGICNFYLSDMENAKLHFMDVLYAAHAINSPFATTAETYIQAHKMMFFSKTLSSAPYIPLKEYPQKNIIDYSDFSDGVFDLDAPDVITIGSLIYNLRIQQKISQKTLCQGLCSNSYLSKIESGIKEPSVILAETLLQRLGISDREFLFWGDEKESAFHQFKFKLRRHKFEPTDEQIQLIKDFKAQLTEKDILYRQHVLLEESYLINDSEKRIEFLKDTLKMTLKDFKIENINNYRLSWIELGILQNIAYEYFYTKTPSDGLLYTQKCIEYHKINHLDCIMQSQTLAHNFHHLFMYLYTNAYHTDTLTQFQKQNLKICHYNLHEYAMTLFYYCQSLGECHNFDLANLNVCYACSILHLLESYETSNILASGFQKDFNLIIDY